MGPGAMMPGSEAMPPGAGYPGGMPPGGGQTPGGKGPIFKKAEKQAVKIVDRTDFIVQFVWVPTIERERKEVDPRAPAPGESTGDAATEAVETPAP
jgi:hypothetical protein